MLAPSEFALGWPPKKLQLLTPVAFRPINGSGQSPPRTILTTHGTCVRWWAMGRDWSGPHRQTDARRNAKSAAGCHAVGQYSDRRYGAARDATAVAPRTKPDER